MISDFCRYRKVIASWHAGSDGGNRSDSENEGELAAAVVRLCRAGSTGSSAGTVTVSQLRSFLCRLCSFRSLQRKIQVISFGTEAFMYIAC